MKLPSSTKLFAAIALAFLVLLLVASPLLAQTTEDERIAQINKENAEKGYHWTAGKTSVSGLSPEEKKSLYGLLPLPEGRRTNVPEIKAPVGASFPAVFDWRALGGVTSVKNQLGCGSCWDFAAVAQLESHILIYDQLDLDLSEQQVLDCNTWGASCNGGWAPAAYDLFQSPGAVSESCYPYLGHDNPPCTQNRCEFLARIDTFMSVENSVDAIKQALQSGPVATAMAALDNFSYYTGGCYDSPNPGGLNHLVLIVGWDDNACGSGQGAWIIKNSWGMGWGIGGFGYVKWGAVGIGSGAYQIVYIPSSIALDAPNGGETWKAGEVHDITWTLKRTPPDSTSILLSLNSGQTYDYTIAHGLIGVTSYSWTVPELPVATARVQIVAYSGGRISGFDWSAADFTIKGKPYRYVSKAGGNRFPYSLKEWAAQNIQDAVHAGMAGDTVRVAGDTYYESITVTAPVYISGGWNATFTERDPQAHVTTIQHFGTPVIFSNVASDSCGVDGFTIKGGTGTYAVEPNQGVYGGAIFSWLSSPTIRGNKIDSCLVTGTADMGAGGAIACCGGSPVIDGNEINGCSSQYGGGVYLYQATATLRHNRISGCYASTEFGGDKLGGGVYAFHSNVTLDGNKIDGSTGFLRGGGIYLYSSPCSLQGDTISANDGSEAGGGIYSQRSSLAAAHVTIRQNTSGSSGAGIYQKAGGLDISNSIIALNRAKTLGGGVYADSAWGGVTNNTIDRNWSKYGGGNVFLYPIPASTLTFRNNLITYGTKNGFQVMNAANVVFKFNNTFGNAPNDVANFTPDSTNTSRNPHYADTSLFDYHLLVHSGGIDTGDPVGGLDPDGSRADEGAFGGPHAFMAAPEYVKNLSASAVNDSTIQLAWDAVSGAASYAVYGCATNGFSPREDVFLGSVTAPGTGWVHHHVSGCVFYRVSAVNAAGYGGGYAAQTGDCASGPDLIPPSVTVLHPNGGEFLKTGDTTSVAWHATDNRRVDSVSIYYSTNAGITYQLIAHGWRPDSTYRWVVPSAVSDSCLVKIVAYDPGLLTGYDASDALFTIKDLTAVHGGGDGGNGPAVRYVTALQQNFPNPFNGTTTISYSVAAPCRVEVTIFDPAGRVVNVLEETQREPGRYTILWRGTDRAGRGVASGVYFCRFKAGKTRQTMKIIYLR